MGLQPPHLPLQLISMWASPNCQSPWPLSWKCSKRNRQKLFPHFLPTASKRDIHKTLRLHLLIAIFTSLSNCLVTIRGKTRQCRTMWASPLAIGSSSPSFWLYFLFIPAPISWQNAFTSSWTHTLLWLLTTRKHFWYIKIVQIWLKVKILWSLTLQGAWLGLSFVFEPCELFQPSLVIKATPEPLNLW